MNLSGEALRAAVRFSIAMFIGDALAIALFGDAITAMFGSYAVVSLLYFLDFDGSVRERLSTYAVATCVGCVAVVIGTLVAPTVWVATVVTIPLVFAFAFARVLKGFAARSAVGLQLPFLLAVMLPANPAHLPQYLMSWILGAAVAVTAAMLIFPRRHTGVIRHALSEWCLRAGELGQAIVDGVPTSVGVENLRSAMARLSSLLTANPQRPGAVSASTRALLQMYEHAEATTSVITALARESIGANAHARPLGPIAIEGLRDSGQLVGSAMPATQLHAANLSEARDADLERAGDWTTDNLATDSAVAVADLCAHYPIRLLSICADVMARLALRSRGVAAGLPTLGLQTMSTPSELIKSNMTWRSVWFRNALRTALAAAAAVWIARTLGVAHGIWVVMATVSIIQMTFSGSDSGRAALRNAFGAVAGVAVGAALVFGHPHVWVFALLLVLTAFLAKFAKTSNMYLIQFTFTLFAIVNISLLGWPPTEKLAELRFLDVLIGVAVAAAFTFAVFPEGLGKLLSRAEAEAAGYAADYLFASAGLLSDAEPDAARFAQLRRELVGAIERYSDALDSSFSVLTDSSPELRIRSAQEVWIRQALLAGDVSEDLVIPGQRPADVPGLAAALGADQADRLSVIRRVARSCTRDLIDKPQALVSATWTCLWLTDLERTKDARSGADATRTSATR